MAKTSNDFIKQYVESFGYKLLNEVSGSKETMQLMCPNGHKWEINFGDFKYGRRCSYCKIEKKKQEQLKLQLIEVALTLQDLQLNFRRKL